MAVPRRVFFVLAILAGALSGALYFSATQRADIVVMARDMDVPRALSADDLETRAISADLLPEDAVTSVSDVIGLVPRAPMLRGQLVLARSVADELADFRSGQAVPTGYRVNARCWTRFKT